MKSGNLNFLEPSGTIQACNGNDLRLSERLQLQSLAAHRFWITALDPLYLHTRNTISRALSLYLYCTQFKWKINKAALDALLLRTITFYRFVSTNDAVSTAGVTQRHKITGPVVAEMVKYRQKKVLTVSQDTSQNTAGVAPAGPLQNPLRTSYCSTSFHTRHTDEMVTFRKLNNNGHSNPPSSDHKYVTFQVRVACVM